MLKCQKLKAMQGSLRISTFRDTCVVYVRLGLEVQRLKWVQIRVRIQNCRGRQFTVCARNVHSLRLHVPI